MSRWVESVERRIAAPADHLYRLVAVPARHRDFDGSGGVRDAVDVSTTERPLRVGDTFDMTMDLRGEYTMTSTVVEAVANRRFAWQSRPHRDSARWRLVFGGRIWRYEFAQEGDTTLVRESWDLNEEPLRPLMVPFRSLARRDMLRSLELMAALAESRE
jgi:activator of Hsp90 ATPase-like protein